MISTTFGPGQSSGRSQMPDIVLGPPRGGGECQGSLDVVSLGNGGAITLGFGSTRIVDRPGPDFVVYENPFGYGCDPAVPYAELGTVAVSVDGEQFVEFPCTATEAPFGACSGHSIVRENPAGVPENELDPLALGGEAYDLADIGLAEARFVRVTDRVDITGAAGVYDLDAVGVVHGTCP
ncbi:MAG: hypothetical protein FJ104_17375 [Deltaproteobacteria bacterium]|nr:hypothetical protein [Deltaproteobacteria bacterium]